MSSISQVNADVLQQAQQRIQQDLLTALAAFSIPEPLKAAVHHAVMLGGKRVRPALCYAAASLQPNPYFAAARRAASLEAKGYLVRKPNPDDGRSQLLYATPKAEKLKNSKAAIETVFYAWLVEELPEAEREAFCKTLETLYWRSKNQRRAGFPDVTARVQQMNGEELQDEEHGKSSG